ncbi:MarR family transcriptional regulator [Roseomonas sp. CAU 1739]|uniref:MarR family winged helix-turn-helix transcriptional regulator n=1 Tax=Roseomonas sp. CAU 1739 TaxID=3140364 RepID=UPI00325B9302
MSRQTESPPPDHVEQRRSQWRRELPEVDTIGMAVLGRARLATILARGPIERVFARHGLDTGEFDVVSTLLRSGPPYRLRPTELYNALMISSGGLTDRLNRLQKAGLIARRRSEEDARSLLVELTAKGRAVAEAAFREDMALEAQLLEGLTQEERYRLAALLARLVAVVTERSAGQDRDLDRP